MATEGTPLLKRQSTLADVIQANITAVRAKDEILKGKPMSKEHLVYNPHFLCSWAIFVCRHGTVFNDAKVWYVASGLFGVALFSGTLLYCVVPRPQDLKTDYIFEIVMYFKVFIAFMLGLFMNSCLSRWFSCMVALTDFFLAIRKLCWMLNANACPLPNREAIQRLAVLSCYLLENEVTMIWTDNHQERVEQWEALTCFLAEEGLVHDHELAILETEVEHDARSARVWVWIGQHIHAIEGLTPPMRGTLMSQVDETCQVISDIKKYVEIQIPFMYSHMLAAFVHLNNILIALACGAAIAVSLGDLMSGWKHWSSSAFRNDELPADVKPRHQVYQAVQAIIGQVFILLIQPIIYQSFLEIATTLCDPFTHKVYGMPLHQHIDELRIQIETGNTLGDMDLDQIEVDYAETKKQKLARLMRRNVLSLTQTEEQPRAKPKSPKKPTSASGGDPTSARS